VEIAMKNGRSMEILIMKKIVAINVDVIGQQQSTSLFAFIAGKNHNRMGNPFDELE
tara:strand:- start:558 stop:725 length:168 start_codon:yes stop_codon:yes gene_type:complete